MTDLFKKKEASELRSVRRELRFTQKEDAQIRHSASLRMMDVSDFIRRAALGRKNPNVDYETEIRVLLLGLRSDIQTLRDLHLRMVDQGIQPPADDWRPVMLAMRAAVERITR